VTDQAGGSGGRAVRIEQTTQDRCALVALRGQLELAAVPRLRQVLLKRLAERPAAVICDLSAVPAIEAASATVFSTVASHPASGWPATSLALCGARPAVAAVLGRLRLPHFLPMHASLEDALANATARPPYLREELVLASSLAAPSAARRFVREVCWYWRLEEPGRPDDPAEQPEPDDLVDRAVLLADELVTNAVMHAGSAGELRLRVELHDERLRVAVHDAVPRLLHPAAFPGPEAEGGRGLILVEELATAWGVHPRAGGKVVWCVLDH
jgi:anti-anti-sigma regulatory factor